MNKVVRQHLEMEQYFSGFSIRDPRRGEGILPSFPTTGKMPAGRKAGTASPPSSTEQSPLRAQSKKATSDEVIALKAAQLEKIAEEVRQCCKCGLGSSRTNAVPGEGNPDARIMFVGEAPGADEDAQGRPFVGRAGQLLDKIIEACGLKREDVFIGNILKCRPPENRDPRAEGNIKGVRYFFEEIFISSAS